MALRDYLISEVGQDRVDGLLTRREALRRLGLLGLTATAAAAVLASCGDDDDDTGARRRRHHGRGDGHHGRGHGCRQRHHRSDERGHRGRHRLERPVDLGGEAPTLTSAEIVAAAGDIDFEGPAGRLYAYVAPAAQPKGAVLVIHENRGLTDHFRDLPGRFAAEGYTALALDLSSGRAARRRSPTRARSRPRSAGLAAADLVADMRAGLDELERRAPGALAVGRLLLRRRAWSGAC